MALVPIPFPVSSTPGRRPGEGEGRLVNAYAVKEGDRAYYRRTPGLASFATTGAAAPRGMIEANGFLYVALANSVVRISSAGAVVAMTGTLPGTDGVTFARNNRVTNGLSTPDIVMVRESGGAYRINGTAVAAYGDADLPATANSVDFLGGYFVFSIPDGRVFASDLNTTAINPLSFATAEAQPDGLKRVFSYSNRIYALGSDSIEIFLNVGSSPFPLRPHTSAIPAGLLTTMAIAGSGMGWDRPPVFVAHDGTVRVLAGYETRPVSTPDVEAFIANSTVSTLEALIYTIKGRAFWALSSNQGTWVLDVASGAWHERTSAGQDRWRGSRSAKFGDRWVVGDRVTGNVLRVDDTIRTEVGGSMPFTVESGLLESYPNQLGNPSLFARFSEGAADVGVSWSHDGGETWAVPLTRSLTDANRHPVRVNRLGLTTHHGLRVRFTSSSSADFSLMGANVSAQTREP